MKSPSKAPEKQSKDVKKASQPEILDEATKQVIQSRKQEIFDKVASKHNVPAKKKSPQKQKMTKDDELAKLDKVLDKEIHRALEGVSQTLRTIYE